MIETSVAEAGDFARQAIESATHVAELAWLTVAVLRFTLILARVAGVVMTAPWFGDRDVPVTVKIGLATGLTSFWFLSPQVAFAWPLGEMNTPWWLLSLAVIAEALFGALIGFWLSLLILPARIAGSYIGQEMGLTISTIADPTSASQRNIISILLEMFAVAVYLATNTHHVALRVLNASLLHWAPGTPPGEVPIEALTAEISRSHHWAFQIAAPIAACLFFNMIFLTLLMRAAPQLNLFAIGFPMRLGVGMFALLAFLPALLSMLAAIYRQAPGFLSF